MKDISHVYKKIGRTKWQPTPVFLSRESRGQRSLGGCCPWGRTESDMTEATLHACIGEGNGNPLQCFCLENPRERGTWWAAVCGVTHRVGHDWRNLAAAAQENKYKKLIAPFFYDSIIRRCRKPLQEGCEYLKRGVRHQGI